MIHGGVSAKRPPGARSDERVVVVVLDVDVDVDGTDVTLRSCDQRMRTAQ
jgi:hypothetical protein